MKAVQLLQLNKVQTAVALVPVATSYSESFEIDLGNWVNSTTDNLDWTRDSGGTPSSSTGPTTGQDGSYYIYVETSSGSAGNEAIIEYDMTEICQGKIDFYYHPYGATIGPLYLEGYNGSTWDQLWYRAAGDGGFGWVNAVAYFWGHSKLRFRYQRGSSYTGDMALDLIKVTPTYYEDFEDTTYNITFTGDWVRTTADKYAGTYGYKAAAITHNETSTTQFTMPFTGTISLWYKVSSESNYDFGDIKVNGVSEVHVSGAWAWTNWTYNATEWDIISFVYDKDGSVDANDNTFYIDNIDLTQESHQLLSYDNVKYLVYVQESNPKGLFFKSDGTKFYTVGYNRAVYEYTMSTPWDISTASYSYCSPTITDTQPMDISFNSTGTKLFITGVSNDEVYEYILSTAWDITTAYSNRSLSVVAQDDYPNSITFKPDGLVLFMNGSQNDSIYKYTLTSAWDFATISYSGVSYSYSGVETTAGGVCFKSDGTKFYLSGSAAADAIYEYTMSTPWDITTASLTNSMDISTEMDGSKGICLNSAENKLFVISAISAYVYQYTIN